MPELPDLQVFGHNLSKMLKGKIVENVIVTTHARVNVSEQELCDALIGREIDKFVRVGKELHVVFTCGRVLGFHLMLHGGFTMFRKDQDKPRHSVVVLQFVDDECLALTDFQNAAVTTLDPLPNCVPDALGVDATYLAQKFGKTKRPIKTVLTDQKVVRGIGNAYADEILWHARISPFSLANKVPVERVKTLVSSIKKVLADAENEIINPIQTSSAAKCAIFWRSTNQKEDDEHRSDHPPKEIGGRKTYYTDEQELFAKEQRNLRLYGSLETLPFRA